MTEFKYMEDDLRKKWPDRAAKAKEGSRKEAIFLHCQSCAGSALEARRCTAVYCFLHPYRAANLKD